MNPLKRALDPMMRRVMLSIGRAVIELINDATKMQSAQVSLLDDEVRDNVEHFQSFGFTSVPEAGAEGVALSVAGNRDHVILVAVDDRRYRKLGLLTGESCVYDKWGNFILLKQSGIEIVHTAKLTITAPLVQINGNLQVSGTMAGGGNATVGGSFTATGDVVGGGKSLVTHVHSGVAPGGSNTGAPV